MAPKNAHRGSKHQIIQALMEHGSTYRKAEHVLTIVLDSITAAIRRGDSVEIDGFGSWSFVRQKAGRVWRFGKVINQRPKRLVFTFTGDLTPFASSADVPQDHGVTQEDDLTRYVKNIRKFLLDDLYAEDYHLFWVLRWNSGWFHNTFAAAENQARYSLDQVRQAIDESRPGSFPVGGTTRSIDLVCWYARWCSALDVKRNLWTEAERIVSSQF
jgi:integration host factor subunit beta